VETRLANDELVYQNFTANANIAPTTNYSNTVTPRSTPLPSTEPQQTVAENEIKHTPTMGFASKMKSAKAALSRPKTPGSPTKQMEDQTSSSQEGAPHALPMPDTEMLSPQVQEPEMHPSPGPDSSASPPTAAAPPFEPEPESYFPTRTSSRDAGQTAQPLDAAQYGGLQPSPVFPQEVEYRRDSSEYDEDEEDSGEDTDFVPLTQAPISTQPRDLTSKQYDCYTNHAVFSEYKSRFQTTGCQVCGMSEPGMKCTCSWCMLQICSGCRDELKKVPGRKLQTLLDRKQGKGKGHGDVNGVEDILQTPVQ
jgi:hypothetical protein